MKKFASLALICALTVVCLSGCGVKKADDALPYAEEAPAERIQISETGDETKDVTLAELLAEVDDEPADAEAVSAPEAAEEAPADAESYTSVYDDSEPAEAPADEEAADAEAFGQEAPDDALITPEPTDAPTQPPADLTLDIGTGAVPTAEALPFATSTPQPNAVITAFSDCTGTGLGFKFRYPTGWTNIPGRATICYVQPTDDGTVYPARVAVTMKKLAHRCTDELCKDELVEYLKTLRTQYDEETFEVDLNLDTSQKFMSKKAMATTYLAYDGKQEIAGYVIMTYFERYVFVFHFLSAYEDFGTMMPAVIQMRDSVQADG